MFNCWTRYTISADSRQASCPLRLPAQPTGKRLRRHDARPRDGTATVLLVSEMPLSRASAAHSVPLWTLFITPQRRRRCPPASGTTNRNAATAPLPSKAGRAMLPSRNVCAQTMLLRPEAPPSASVRSATDANNLKIWSKLPKWGAWGLTRGGQRRIIPCTDTEVT